MSDRNYYIDLFTPETWQEAAAHGFTVSGFSERRMRYAKRIHPGDVFLCYLTGKSRFIGALRVTSEVFHDTTPIWESQPFPTRFRCELIVQISEDTGIHLREVQAQSDEPATYNWIFRASPQLMPRTDAEWILERLHDIAQAPSPTEPVQLEVGADEPAQAELGPADATPSPAGDGDEPASPAPGRAHTRIQWKLAKLGRDLGLRVWVASNDRSTTYDGIPLGDLSIDQLPVTFDRTTQGTVERIDVLWLQRNSIVAAFEIESTTAIYSGLLRMSDLLAMQPNINIALYLVAPDERREHVHREIRRPTFARLERPLHEVCRYIPFSKLDDAVERFGAAICYMRPDFIESIAESVA